MSLYKSFGKDHKFEHTFLGPITRRRLLGKTVAFGASIPGVMGLLAACGGDDDDDTSSEDQSTATEIGSFPEEESTPTEATTESVPETAESAETPSESEIATETATEEPATPSETEAPTSAPTDVQAFEGSDRLMGKEIEEAAREGGVVIEGSTMAVVSLNPMVATDAGSADVISLIYESMFETNPETLAPVGNLTESWSVAGDNVTWTINLRQGVKWHDGESFTAEDVEFTYELRMNPETATPGAADLRDKLASIEVIDEHTIQMVTSRLIPDFEFEVGDMAILPKHIWESVAPADVAQAPGSTGEDPSQVIGTGPFTFNEWILEDRVTLDRNEDYWDGAPRIDQYIHRYVGDQSSMVQALRVGDIDIGRIPPSSVGELEDSGVATPHSIPTLSFTLYGTNMDPERTPVFQDVEVRQALLYALDREALIEAIRFGYGEVAIGTMPSLSWAANPDEIEMTYPYDPDKAVQLLDDAGWVLGDGNVRSKDDVPLSFEMHAEAGNPVMEGYLVAFQEAWREIGVEMTPRPEPFAALVERIYQTKDFDAFMIRFGWTASVDQSHMWTCNAFTDGFNAVRYCTPEVDEILLAAASTLDRDERIRLYTEFQNVLLSDLPMVVFDFLENLDGVSNRLHNYFPSTLNDKFNAETWWVEG